MSLSSLQPNGLYIALYLRSDPHIPHNFHWAFYLHLHPITGGVKYHIRNQGDGWMADHGATAGILKEFLLVGLMQVAHVPAASLDIDDIMKAFDHDLNAPGQTCRVRLFRVLQLLLRTAVPRVVLLCDDDVEALEKQVKAWGNGHAQGAIGNIQPRPVLDLPT
jgi:hypothetical protein